MLGQMDKNVPEALPTLVSDYPTAPIAEAKPNKHLSRSLEVQLMIIFSRWQALQMRNWFVRLSSILGGVMNCASRHTRMRRVTPGIRNS